MTMQYPSMVVAAGILTAVAAAGYVMVARRRRVPIRAVRRHLPYLLFLAALPLLLTALARPQAQISLPRVAGTVVLVFDVSTSMAADDVQPSRLAAAQAAATGFVQAQPDSVDIGVVIFGQNGLTTQPPTADHGAVNAAIARLTTSGGTSLTQAILGGLTAITGEPVSLPAQDQPSPDLGYWGSATIVLFSDGEDTAGSRVDAAAELAAAAGVHIETIGIGTADGTTVEVDGYQVATALDEAQLTAIAEATGGSYHPAGDAAALERIQQTIDKRLTTRPETVEVTALFAAAALALLTAGGLLMIRWYGRIV